MSPPELHLRPTLARAVRLQLDPLTGRPVLLYPEGVLELNETSYDTLARCNGARTTREILDLLAAEYEVAPEELEADVRALLDRLRERNFLAFEP